jgi:hypothetical protein
MGLTRRRKVPAGCAALGLVESDRPGMNVYRRARRDTLAAPRAGLDPTCRSD